MRKQSKKALIKILIDRSGSIASCLSDMQGGYDTFIKERQKEKGVKQFISLSQFDTQYELVYPFVDINEVPEHRIVPRGGTALLDSIAKIIAEVDERPEASDDKITKIIVIITDGLENSSIEFGGSEGRERTKRLIEERKSKGWVFIYQGANQDAISVASGMGIPAASSMTFNPKFSDYSSVSTSSMVTRGMSGLGYAYTMGERKGSIGESSEVKAEELSTSAQKLNWDESK